MRWVLAFLLGGWMVVGGVRSWAQDEGVVGVLEQPMQIFLQPVKTDGVRADLGPEADRAAFLLEVVRVTYQADLARVLTQHIAPTRLIEGKTQPSAPGWEVRTNLSEVRWQGAEGKLGLAVVLEVFDLRAGKVVLKLEVRSGLDPGVELPQVDDDDAVTPWNPPPPRMSKVGVAKELVEAVQAETNQAVRRAVYLVKSNIRQGR